MPERSCIVCGKKGTKGELVRLVDTPSGVMPDYNEKLPGRGAYICPSRDCIARVAEKGALGRAFRKAVTPPSPDVLANMVAEAADRRIRSLLGMARKSGLVAYGRDSVAKAAASSPGGLLVVAGDVSESTLSGLVKEAGGSIRETVRYLDKEGIGMIMGSRPVGLVYIADDGLASALSREFDRALLNTGGED